MNDSEKRGFQERRRRFIKQSASAAVMAALEGHSAVAHIAHTCTDHNHAHHGHHIHHGDHVSGAKPLDPFWGAVGCACFAF